MYRIGYCEFSRQNPDRDVIYRPAGRTDWLFLLFLSPMEIFFPDRKEIAPAGSCLLYTPHTPQHYQAVGSFRNSYVHFWAEQETPARYHLPLNRLFYPADPDLLNRQVKALQEEYLLRGEYGTEMEDLLLRRLWISCARQLQKRDSATDPLRSQFQKMRLAMLSQCEEEWDIHRMCRLVNMGKSQFYHYYRHFFDASPHDELLAARIDRAKNLLTNRAIQVQQAAALCGFQNVCHFTRHFRAVCGCSPGEYRRRSGGDHEGNG